MNDVTSPITARPEVEQFVAAVRGHFADLDPEEREELLDGLEADVTDRVAEEGGGLLGDPATYAAELRAAAGLPPVTKQRRPVRSAVHVLSDSRAAFDRFVARHDWAQRVLDFLTAIRPAWWVLRGWLIVQAVDAWTGPWEKMTLLPSLGAPGLGPVLTLAAIVVSVQVGRGLRPTTSQSTWPPKRIAVLAANAAVLLVAVPVTLEYSTHPGFAQGPETMGSGMEGVTNAGQPVCNLTAYDASGEPLQGVQLFDQGGRPLNARCTANARTSYPWLMGDAARWNVFPQASRLQPNAPGVLRDGAYDSGNPPAFPTSDRASVPPVTHPLGNATTGEAAAGVLIYDGEQVCTVRVESKGGKRLKDVRVIDVTGGRRLPMNNAGC